MPAARDAGAWIWVVVVVAASAVPFRNNLEEVRKGTPHFFWYVTALALVVAGVAAYLLLRDRVRRWELAVFGGAVALLYLVREPVATLLAVWVVVVSYAAGGVLLGWLRAEVEGGLARWILWTAAGLGMVSAAMFCLGLLHGYHRWVVLGLLAVVTWMLRRRIRGGLDWGAAPAGPLMGLCTAFGLMSAVLGALVVLTPETTFDPVATHLYEARYYAENGRFVAPPTLSYHYFPKGVEMLQTLGFVVGGQAAAQVLGYLFTPLAVGAVLVLARRRYGGLAGVLAAGLVLTTPLVVLDGSVAKNDLAMALYHVLSLYSFLRWKEDGQAGWAWAMSLFLGLGFGVKHTALVGALPLFGLIAWELWKQNAPWRRRAEQAVAMAGLVVAAGGYWHIRTWALTGSPTYPLRSDLAYRPTKQKRLQAYGIALYAIFYNPEYRLPEARSPNVMGFAVLALLPVAFRRGRRRDGVLWLMIGISYLYWERWAENLRFLIPTWMVLLIALSGRAGAYWEDAGRTGRAAVVAAAGYCFVFALQVSMLLTLHVPRVRYIAGQLDRREYLRRILSVYPAVEWLNREVRPGERVCAMLTCPRLYAQAPMACLLEDRWQPAAGRISEEVVREGCSYVVGPGEGRVIGDVVYREEGYWVSRVGTLSNDR